MALGDAGKALRDFTEAIRLNPKCAAAYENRGRLYRKAGDRAEAESDLGKSRQLRVHNDTSLWDPPTFVDAAAGPLTDIPVGILPKPPDKNIEAAAKEAFKSGHAACAQGCR